MIARRAFLLAALLSLLAACGGQRAEPLPPGSVVLALGDSLTAGYGLDPEQAWPALLAARTGWQIVNGGVSGDQTADALARLPALMDEHAPKLVLVTLGGNDMLRKLPEAQTRGNLARILALTGSRGAQPVLLATPRPSVAGVVFQRLSAAPFYAEIARERKVPLIEDAIAEVLSDPDLKLDQLHPNAEGQRVLADKLFDALRKLGYVR
ncbi:MAG: arylesterase [Burkholderiales bacterium]|nr:arylesterase [Zoogloeaceae bacterium]MBP9653304.1 arylesterase [Rhodocyclaceae bacterium]MCZ2175121.1 arylesterase [Burkholderiales bacterium]HNQ56868.1 arylesterase [Candidatus Desulfobacillus denitrificans]MBV6411278.1 Thioesterase 1/protease 1/lysophospholipase L1 [Rhodocyclaceae bacterium]